MDGERDEPLVEGLGSIPGDAFRGLAPDDDARARIWTATSKAVRLRAVRRRLRWATGFAAAYVAGALTVLALSGALRGAGPGGRAPDDRPDRPSRERPGGPVEGDGLAAAAVSDPAALVRAGLKAPAEERSRLLRTAGDLYLSQSFDVRSAVACYREHLKDSKDSEEPRPGDSWLLVYLKAARETEVRREKADG